MAERRNVGQRHVHRLLPAGNSFFFIESERKIKVGKQKSQQRRKERLDFFGNIYDVLKAVNVATGHKRWVFATIPMWAKCFKCFAMILMWVTIFCNSPNDPKVLQ